MIAGVFNAGHWTLYSNTTDKVLENYLKIGVFL